MANAAQQLQEAYQQIEQGNLQEARQLLDEIRPQNENNPDFWWVYAHAIEDENEGRNALNRVRQLAPNYPGLQEVEEQAGIRVAPPSVQPLQKLGSMPKEEDIFDDLDDLDSEFDDLDEEEESSGGFRNILIGVGGFIVLLVIIFLLLAVSGIFGGGDAEPTEVVAQDTPQVSNTVAATTEEATEVIPTEELATEIVDSEATVTLVVIDVQGEATEDLATEEIAPTETEEVPPETEEPATTTPEPTEVIETDPFAALYGDLAAFGVPEDGISIEETTLGNSIVVNTCANPGPTANNNIIGVMDVFAAAGLEIAEDVEAITFNITSCDTNTVTLALALGRDAFTAYLAGESSPAELLQAIQRLA